MQGLPGHEEASAACFKRSSLPSQARGGGLANPDMDAKTLAGLVVQPCFACGMRPALSQDRIDNATGYSDNCQGACANCNMMRVRQIAGQGTCMQCSKMMQTWQPL